MERLTQAVKHLIIINVIFFLAPKLLGSDLQNTMALHFPTNPDFGYWQFLSHIFMHSQANFYHILFNMYGLWAFGTPLEQIWGRNRFLFFYFSAGIGAGLVYTAVNYYQFQDVYNSLINIGLTPENIQEMLDTRQYYTSILETISSEDLSQFYNTYYGSAVGASGAVYGVLVAFGMAFPNSKLALIFFPVPISAKYFIPLLILGDLFFGITKYSIGNIAHFAHVGGALIGFIIAWYWKKHQFKRWD
ncbi:MAG: rhomboid family intramembrane serine protease [Flavobacteriaceae bacterium]|nr:rhomboid family intramembrane serine protease [Flavobacteriaceae bacterium]